MIGICFIKNCCMCPFYIKFNSFLLKFSGNEDYYNSLTVRTYEMIIDVVLW